MTESRPKIEIIPAVLPQSFKELEESLAPLNGVVRRVQVDVVDGSYARPKSWPYRDSASFEKIVQEEHGLPFWDSMDFQFDLMIERPQEEIKKYLQAGASQVVLHARSAGSMAVFKLLVEMRTEEMGTFAVHAGIALGAEENLEALEQFEGQYDFVQVMGVDHEGRQGEPFDRKALYLVERLRRRYPHLPIQVDGGVSLENARELVAAGATALVVGHAIVKASDPALAYKELYNRVNAQ